MTGIKALVVDDNADLRLLLSRVLEIAGIAVEQAANGPDAILALGATTKDAPDFVLLDIQMPEMDGFEVLRVIRDELGSNVPIVLCSVKSDRDDRSLGWRLGADGYVSKPFDVEELISEVRAVTSLEDGARATRRASALAHAF